MSVTLRCWAAARTAAGRDDIVVEGASTLGELLAAAPALADDPAELARVLLRCSFLVDGIRVNERSGPVALDDDTVVEALPPFAGG